MGRIKQPLPVKLLVPMLGASQALLDDACTTLVGRFGPADLSSAPIPFVHTDYYAREMGAGLLRRFISFERLIDPGELAGIKLMTNDLERGWSVEGQRRVNLDPGYLTPGKLVLATTKDQAHRVYLGGGIYAEVTMAWREGDFRPWPWTYPDYASDAYLAVLRAMRGLYMSQLRKSGLLQAGVAVRAAQQCDLR